MRSLEVLDVGGSHLRLRDDSEGRGLAQTSVSKAASTSEGRRLEKMGLREPGAVSQDAPTLAASVEMSLSNQRA